MNRLERELDFKLSASLLHSREREAIKKLPRSNQERDNEKIACRFVATHSFTPPQEHFHTQTGFPAWLHPTWTPSRRQYAAVAVLCPFVGFTVTGVARNFHPHSLGGVVRQRLFRRRCIRYSFRHSIRSIDIRVNGEAEILRAPPSLHCTRTTERHPSPKNATRRSHHKSCSYPACK